jgi:hypothetical protein
MAGMPTTVAPSGTPRVTTALAPTVALNSDRHPAQDGDSTSEPDVAANRDWFCAIPGITNRLVRFPVVICVTDAGVFTDQAAVTDLDSGQGYDICAARNQAQQRSSTTQKSREQLA